MIETHFTEYGTTTANNNGSGNAISNITETLEPGVYCAIASQQTANSISINISFQDSSKGTIIGTQSDGYNTTKILVFTINETCSVTVKSIAYNNNWCYSSCTLIKL